MQYASWKLALNSYLGNASEVYDKYANNLYDKTTAKDPFKQKED